MGEMNGEMVNSRDNMGDCARSRNAVGGYNITHIYIYIYATPPPPGLSTLFIQFSSVSGLRPLLQNYYRLRPIKFYTLTASVAVATTCVS